MTIIRSKQQMQTQQFHFPSEQSRFFVLHAVELEQRMFHPNSSSEARAFVELIMLNSYCISSLRVESSIKHLISNQQKFSIGVGSGSNK